MIIELIAALLVGQALAAVGIFAYNKWDDRKRRRELQHILELGMNRPSFPMCSPSRDLLSNYSQRSRDQNRQRTAYESYLQAMAKLGVQVSPIDQPRIDELEPIPAPDWTLPKKEAE